jgi:endo-alpha-N-acetylgalactosaminidase
VVSADSEQRGEGEARHALDNDPATYWHTQWSGGAPPHPHEIVIDLGEAVKLDGIKLMQRADQANGRIADCEAFASDSPNFGNSLLKAKLANHAGWQTVKFPQPQTARYLKLRANSEVGGNPWTALAEFSIVPSVE